LTATMFSMPMPWDSEHAGGGFATAIVAVPLPLLEIPTKQELPQPATLMAARTQAQENISRRFDREKRMG
jgi:hypothetical protein